MLKKIISSRAAARSRAARARVAARPAARPGEDAAMARPPPAQAEPCEAGAAFAASLQSPVFPSRATRAPNRPASRPPRWTCAATSKPIRRRALLVRAAATTVALSTLARNPPRADALSKKRILAKAGPEVELANGVRYRDITTGKGYSPQKGDTVAIHYSVFYDDLEVESSRESQGLAALPLGFSFGAESGPGSAMKGLNLGMDGMKVGGLRLISIPPQFAYGERGKMPLIPPNAVIDMAVSLLSVKRVGTNPNSMLDPNAQKY